MNDITDLLGDHEWHHWPIGRWMTSLTYWEMNDITDLLGDEWHHWSIGRSWMTSLAYWEMNDITDLLGDEWHYWPVGRWMTSLTYWEMNDITDLLGDEWHHLPHVAPSHLGCCPREHCTATSFTSHEYQKTNTHTHTHTDVRAWTHTHIPHTCMHAPGVLHNKTRHFDPYHYSARMSCSSSDLAPTAFFLVSSTCLLGQDSLGSRSVNSYSYFLKLLPQQVIHSLSVSQKVDAHSPSSTLKTFETQTFSGCWKPNGRRLFN